MTTFIVCLVCPKSCEMEVEHTSAYYIKTIKGNECARGKCFAEKELSGPERTLTSSIRIMDGSLPLISVRSDRPVKKSEIKDIVCMLTKVTATAPIAVGEILLSNVGKNQVNIVATRSVKFDQH